VRELSLKPQPGRPKSSLWSHGRQGALVGAVQQHDRIRSQQMRASFRALCVLALWIALVPGLATPAQAACRQAATPNLPMPAWTWLRSWRADLSAPIRLAADDDGRVWVADPTRGQVVARSADGSVAEVRRALGWPASLARASLGAMVVGDGRSGRVTVYDVHWNPAFALGAGDGEFGHPGDIVVDPTNGDIYVSDTARHIVAVYSAAGVRLRTIGSPAPANDSPAADGQFRTPTGIALAGNELLVSDQLNYRVQAFDKASGAYLYCLGTFRASSFFPPNSGPARTFGMAQGLWVDALGRLYVVDAYQGQVRVFDRGNGALIGAIGVFGAEPGALRNPSDLLIDRQGRLLVSNTDHARIELYGLDSYADPEAFAPAAVRVDPVRIDRTAPPASVELALEVPGYRLIDIDPVSLRVNGLVPTIAAASPRDRDGNGWPELLLGVGGSALLGTLPPQATQSVVSVSGRVGALGFVARSTVEPFTPVRDRDGDGVPDGSDACPGSAPGVPVDLGGCSLAQSCPCNGPAAGGVWVNKGAYLQCLRTAAEVLIALGKVDRNRLGELVSQAASSTCGRKP
jgi:sugar lactone lactonase YvrE